MRYIVFNDPHIAVNPPSPRRKDDYLEACFNALDFIRDVAVQKGCDALICTGDWFHHKHPLSVPYRVTHRLSTWVDSLAKEGIPLLTVFGNHDVPYQTVDEKTLTNQPASVLLSHKNVHWLDKNYFFCRTTGWYVTGRSFLAPVEVDGEWVEPNLSVVSKAPERTIHITHNNVYPKDYPFPPFTHAETLAKTANAKIHHTGHIHDNLGLHKYEIPELGDVYWSNTGSMMFGALSETEIARKPSVLFVDADTLSFSEITIPSPPIEEIYDVEGYKEQKASGSAKKEWVESLKKQAESSDKYETVEEIIDKSSLDFTGKQLAKRIYNKASGQ